MSWKRSTASLVWFAVATCAACGQNSGSSDGGLSTDTTGSTDSETLDTATDTGSEAETESGTGPEPSCTDTEIVEGPDRLPGWRMTWLRHVGGPSPDSLASTASIGDDTVVTGLIFADVVFDECGPNETVAGIADDNMFLARYDPLGGLKWAIASQGGVDSMGMDVDASPDGQISVTGFYKYPTTFGTGSDEITISAPHQSNSRNVFVARFDGSGRPAWVRTGHVVTTEDDPAGCEPDDNGCSQIPSGVAVRPDGSTLVVGEHVKLVRFTGAPAPGQTLASRGGVDGFIVAYDEAGALLWTRQIGGTGDDGLSSVAAMPDGSFYVSGYYEGAATLGAGEPNETTLAALDFTSAFLARFDSEGGLVWARDLEIDGHVAEYVGDVTILENGDVAITGRYQGRMPAGDGEGGEPVETPAEGRGIFLARYAPDGDRLWNRVALSSKFLSFAIETGELHDGSLVVVGKFAGQTVFGAGEPNETKVGDPGEIMDAYVALYSFDGRLEWVLEQGGANPDSLGNIEVHYDDATGDEWFVVGGNYAGEVLFGTGGGDEQWAHPHDNAWSDMVLMRFDRE